jgi:peptidoglycan hydrolase-like protein with peptidoglycan-binding domain
LIKAGGPTYGREINEGGPPMALNSAILKGTTPNPRLEQAAAGPPSIKPAPPADDAEAVRRIQRGLVALGLPLPRSFPLGPSQPPDGAYGQETYNAVIKFQQTHFPTQPGEWDGRAGKNTLLKMDSLLPAGGTAPAPVPVPPVDKPKVIADAKARSRTEVTVVLNRMNAFESAIRAADLASGNQKILAIQTLGRLFARDIAIIADKLRTSGDPLSAQFRGALASAKTLVQNNLGATSGIIDEGNLGRCTASNFSPPGVPFAATTRTAPDPRVSVCTPFFAQNDDMKRDVITHEFFHLLGLADVNAINNTADALNDANTMAQVVAYMHDRARTRDSSGLSQPRVTYPTP